MADNVWLLQPLALSPEVVVAHLPLDTSLVAPATARYDANLEHFGERGLMQQRQVLRGKQRRTAVTCASQHEPNEGMRVGPHPHHP
jgi:hypothetical protein